MSLTRRSTLGLMAGAVLAPSVLRAQSFPTKPITLVVPYPAGGPTDAIARFVAQDLSTSIGQNVVVDNRAGASGAVGTRAVAKADPDGHTIVFGNNQTHGNNMFLLKEPGYDAVKDFAPLAGVGAFEHAFVVRNDLPAKTIKELKRFFETPNIPVALKPYIDTAHMLYARALYGFGNYSLATEQYRMVNKKSNELAASLSELSWAYLQAERYNEAIGTAMSMQAGAMRHTFAPEGPMVMAMALNEICQYPESVRAAGVFRKHYEDAFRWLAKWKENGKSENLYPLALEFLRKTGKTPTRVARRHRCERPPSCRWRSRRPSSARAGCAPPPRCSTPSSEPRVAWR